MLCDTGASRTIAISLIRAVLSRGHKLCGKYRRARGRESRACPLRVLLPLPALTATSGTSSYFPLMRKRPPAVWDGAAPKFNTSGEQRWRLLFSTCVTVSSRTVASSPEHQQVVSRSGLVVRRRYLVHSDVADGRRLHESFAAVIRPLRWIQGWTSPMGKRTTKDIAKEMIIGVCCRAGNWLERCGTRSKQADGKTRERRVSQKSNAQVYTDTDH